MVMSVVSKKIDALVFGDLVVIERVGGRVEDMSV